MGQCYSRLSWPLSNEVVTTTAAVISVASISWYHYGHRVLASIYNQMIVHMTREWYRAVLNQVEDDSIILDVGIGTAGTFTSNEQYSFYLLVIRTLHTTILSY